jgi:GNAT superfamily N-acetyltransferase
MTYLHMHEPPWQLPDVSNALLPALERSQLESQAPDAHLRIVDERNLLLARCSLWWNQVPEWPEHRLGAIGHFAAVDEASTHALLDAACARLKKASCSLAVGPLDGNTWRSYRLVTESSDRAPFLLEPHNPSAWPQWWIASDFQSFQSYQSSMSQEMNLDDPRLQAVQERLQGLGVRWRSLDSADFDGELERIFEVSEAAFQNAVLYTPLPRAAFLAMYQKVRPYVRETLVWIAEQGDRPVGFVFAVPDLAQAQQGMAVDTVIVKTLAILPDRAYAGLGKVLLEKAHAAAQGMGMSHVIHALMHDQNRSTLMGKGSRVIRRYTLFSKELA